MAKNIIKQEKPVLEQTHPGTDWVAIVTDTDIPENVRALWIGQAGHLVLLSHFNNTVTFQNVPVGLLPLRPKQVVDAGTSAGLIIGII